MKIIELKENESLDIIEVFNRVEFRRETTNIIKTPIIQMKVFTDGEIVKKSDETSKQINEYYIGKEKYENVDTLKIKKMYFKNYSYVTTCLIAPKLINTGYTGSVEYVVKEIFIYLQNPKDTKALKNAKQAIRKLENRGDIIFDYFSIFRNSFFQSKELKKVETKNVYSLKKVKTLNKD